MVEPQNNSANAGETRADGQPAGKSELLAGKYPTVEELVRGYEHQFGETQRIIAERDGLKRQVDVLVPLVSQNGGNERVMPADRVAARGNAVDDLVSAINDNQAVTREQLISVIDAVASARVQPIVEGLNARQTIAREVPEFAKFEGEVAQFLQTHSDVGARFAKVAEVDPAAAMKLGFLEWKFAVENSRASEGQADTTGSQALNSRLDAQMVGGTGGRGASAAVAAGAVEAALAKAQRTNNRNDWAEYIAIALGDDTQR